jgi:hypothetical protein
VLDDANDVIAEFVDYLMPELTPYEATLYLFLLRNSLLRDGAPTIRIGKRTIAERYGTGARGNKTNYAHVTKVVGELQLKGCIRVGDTSREGTLYTVVAPRDVPLVVTKLNAASVAPDDDDYFNAPERRRLVFERDDWTCQYCGERVTEANATLDHYVPQCQNGSHSKENLRTACLVCNGVKSGKSFEEAAPALLRSMQERRSRARG